jgi:putative transposase
MGYSTGSHTIFHCRYYIVLVPKYRFKVLYCEVRLRVREIIKQVCAEMGVTILHGLLSRDHVHMFVEIPPHIAVSQFVQRAKGRSSRKIQSEFEHILSVQIRHSASHKVGTSKNPSHLSM